MHFNLDLCVTRVQYEFSIDNCRHYNLPTKLMVCGVQLAERNATLRLFAPFGAEVVCMSACLHVSCV